LCSPFDEGEIIVYLQPPPEHHTQTVLSVSPETEHKFGERSKKSFTTALRALMLTFRFFIQNNERCSVKNVVGVYGRLDVLEERKRLVGLARADLNAYLAMPSVVALGEEQTKLTNGLNRGALFRECG
jgi:hypothetical protein